MPAPRKIQAKPYCPLPESATDCQKLFALKPYGYEIAVQSTP